MVRFVSKHIFYDMCVFVFIYQEKLSFYMPWIIYSTVAWILDIIMLITMIVQPEDMGKIIGQLVGVCKYFPPSLLFLNK